MSPSTERVGIIGDPPTGGSPGFPPLSILRPVTEVRPLFLVGMMGAGKSTVGPALARRLRRPFVDSDSEVERRAGKSVAEIFREDGEAAFRLQEASVLEDLGNGDRAVVVALGGGAIAQPGAPERLGRCATVVYLRASPERLLQRVGDGSSRPILRGLDGPGRLARLREVAADREASYQTARLVIDTDESTISQVVAKIELGLAEIETTAPGVGEE